MAQIKDPQIKKVAVLTSGGDAPGMNAAIRAVVRSAHHYGYETIGVYQGYQGLIEKKFINLNLRSVANTIQRGGTILKAGRCPEFHQQSFRQLAYENLQSEHVDALVCIGGDGTLTGAHALYEDFGMKYIGVPGTIDNDINQSDSTIGFDTSVNTALEAIDRIRDTAASHNRLFIVEVMGRDSGFIATHVGLAGGAEGIFIPENPFNIDDVVKGLEQSQQNGKLSSILVTAEGQKPGRAYDLAKAIRKSSGQQAKVCILGHIQRGGSPTASDRILASRMGASAIEGLSKGFTDVMVAIQANKMVFKESSLCLKGKSVEKNLISLSKILSK